MSAVAIIPARGGSRRIPRKNIKLFHGKPIIAYSIEAAKESGLFESVVVSTDDFEISSIANRLGALVLLRDSELAKDEIGTQQVMRHVLAVNPAMSGVDYACCIYPCAPLIRPSDLRQAYKNACYSTYNYVYADGQFYLGVALRFVESPNDFSHSLRMESMRYIDINTPEDFSRAEKMYAELHGIKT